MNRLAWIGAAVVGVGLVAYVKLRLEPVRSALPSPFDSPARPPNQPATDAATARSTAMLPTLAWLPFDKMIRELLPECTVVELLLVGKEFFGPLSIDSAGNSHL
jgi:hypothetical protein